MTRKFQTEEIDRMSLADAEEFYNEELVTMCNKTLNWQELKYLENRITKLKQKVNQV